MAASVKLSDFGETLPVKDMARPAPVSTMRDSEEKKPAPEPEVVKKAYWDGVLAALLENRAGQSTK